MSTTTDDLEGEPLLTQPQPELNLETVTIALQEFQGLIQQVPPNYSAVQVKGKRLYDLARAGKEIVIQSRQVEVFGIKVLDWRPAAFPELDLEIACGPGTYIRAIARDLGKALQTGGMLTNLIRTSSCGFDLSNSLTLETLETQIEQTTFQPIPPEIALNHIPAVLLPAEIARRWGQGQRILLAELPAQSLVEHNETEQPMLERTLRVYDADGHFLGVGRRVVADFENILVPQVVIGNGEGGTE